MSTAQEHIKRITAEREGTEILKDAELVSYYQLRTLFDERAVEDLGLQKYLLEVDPFIP